MTLVVLVPLPPLTVVERLHLCQVFVPFPAL
ncbi:hypothetical protein A2U01_0079239, partial [Trifolium medium]|nr:hypothetical protein [Trifolium medium]